MRRLQRGLAARPLPRVRSSDLWVPADHDGPRVPVRVFQPHHRRRRDVILFLHGGGWVTGDIESYTPACATMADLTGCTVASVDYRLAPEHPFPAGLEDCLRVVRQVLEDPSRAGVDSARRIVLVGDSAGGNLAAAVNLQLHREGSSGVGRQILLYPVTHWDHDPDTSPFGSVAEQGQDHRLRTGEVQDYMEMYVPDPTLRRDPLVSPLMATDLSGQPPTLVMTAGLDLLRDEGEAYAHALGSAGTPVRVHRIDDAVHGFITLPRAARSLREAYTVIDAFLDEVPAAGGGTS
jgi:acetyl esterase